MKIIQGDEVECSHAKHLAKETVLATWSVTQVWLREQFAKLSVPKGSRGSNPLHSVVTVNKSCAETNVGNGRTETTSLKQ